MLLQPNNPVYLGMTFSQAIQFAETNAIDDEFYERIVTVEAITEDPNISESNKIKLINMINSDIPAFEKRIKIMRFLDKGKEFSSKIAKLIVSGVGRMKMVEHIIEIYRDEYIKSDILKKEFGEVLTPLNIVIDMVNTIDDDFWTSSRDKEGNIKKILDPCSGSGIYPWYVIYKFMTGLESEIPNEEERYKFIIENMIYVCEIQRYKMFNWLCTIDLYDTYKVKQYRGSFLSDEFDSFMKNEWKLTKFHLILGNPPYQEMDGGAKASARPIYNLFTMKSISISERILFITPSRWFAGGKGLDKYRAFMMSSNKIKLINHFDDASKIFGNGVDLPGGVSYFLFDNKYNGLSNFNGVESNISILDVIITDINSLLIINKISKFESIYNICDTSNYFGIDYRKGRGDRIKKEKTDQNHVKVFVSQKKGFENYIDRKYLKVKNNNWRVATPRANGELPNFGNMFIIKPDEYISDAYISFRTNSENEAKSLLSYLKTSFANYLLSIRKISQDIKPDTCKWIPMVPFDREWTDELLFDYFNLAEDEKKLILNND